MPGSDEARHELRSLAERYAQGVDRREVETFVALFHDDAVITIHDPGESTEPRELRGIERLAKIPEIIQEYAKTFHLLGQSTYDIGDGTATGEVYCIAHHLTPDAQGGTNYVMYIRYEDTYRTDADGVWKFAQRRLRVDWTETRAVNPPEPVGGSPVDRALTGQRAIVVGGGSGIGLACARVLARDGAAVTIVGRTEQKLADATAALAEDDLTVAYCTGDALDGDSVRHAVDVASDDERRLQIAVVVPGGGGITPVLLYDDDQFSAEVDGNVRPIFLFLKYAGQAMVRAGGGSFVAISSTAAVFSTRYLSSYAAGKAAVDQLVRVAADELGELGIRVNAVQPGLTNTAATAGMFRSPEMLALFLAEQPLARHGDPDDIAQAVRFFAGPESSWVTGQLLTVDGGNTLRSFIDYRKVVPVPDQGEAP